MSRARRVAVATFALGLLAAGLYIAAAQLFWSGLISVKAMLAAGLMIGLGGWLLWEDVLAPLIGRSPWS